MAFEKTARVRAAKKLTERAEDCFQHAEEQHAVADEQHALANAQHANAEKLVVLGETLEADAVRLLDQIEEHRTAATPCGSTPGRGSNGPSASR